jgi:hypothetical protein
MQLVKLIPCNRVQIVVGPARRGSSPPRRAIPPRRARVLFRATRREGIARREGLFPRSAGPTTICTILPGISLLVAYQLSADSFFCTQIVVFCTHGNNLVCLLHTTVPTFCTNELWFRVVHHGGRTKRT